MAINTYLDDIKEANYGEDVRDSIIAALKECYSDATGNPDSILSLVKGYMDREDNINVAISTITSLYNSIGETVYGTYDTMHVVSIVSQTDTEINSVYLKPGTWILFYNIQYYPSDGETNSTVIQSTIRRNDGDYIYLFPESRCRIIQNDYSSSITLHCSMVVKIEADDETLIIDSNPDIDGTKLFYLYLTHNGSYSANVRSTITSVRVKNDADSEDVEFVEQITSNTEDIEILKNNYTSMNSSFTTLTQQHSEDIYNVREELGGNVQILRSLIDEKTLTIDENGRLSIG